MGLVSTSAFDLIVGALRNINALEAGETPNPSDSADALQVMNDLLESWSTDKLMVVASLESILSWTPGKYQYSVGNPTGGTFSGTLILGSPTVSGVTVPSNLIAGGTVTDTQGSLPANTTVLSFNAGAGTVTLSRNALFTVNPAEQFTFTVPGDFAIQRPIRVSNAFTRITAPGTSGLDYPIDVDITGDKYTAIGLKGIPGPWPILLWYNTTYPYGTIYCYPNPQTAGELHLFTDNIFSSFTSINQSINMPQGYVRAIKKNLALELAPEYKKSPTPLLIRQAGESVALLKKLNATPAVQAFFDSDLVRANRNDAGWIMHGGFN